MLLRWRFPRAGCLRVITAGSFAGLFLVGTAFAAGPPIPFDNYSVSGGVITAPCPVAPPLGECSDELTDNGMFQRKVSIFAGVNAGEYIQFILTDPGATGSPVSVSGGQGLPVTLSTDPFSDGNALLFSNEDFVKQNNRTAGIASKQTIADTNLNGTLEDRLFMSTKYEFGWAQTGTFPWVDAIQLLSQVDTTDSHVLMDQGAHIISNANGFNNDLKVTLTQDIDLSEPGEGGGVQGFKFVKALGQYQLTDGTAGVTVLPGETLYYQQYNEIRALWIGQTLEQGGINGNAVFGLNQFGALDDISTLARQIVPEFVTVDMVSFTDPNAVANWGLISAAIEPDPVLMSYPNIVAATAAHSVTGVGPTLANHSSGGATTVIDWLDPADTNYIYGQWSVLAGVITPTGCPSIPPHTIVCGDAGGTGSGGFYQRVVSIDGEEYIQTIVTDENATGDPNADVTAANYLAFASENFVKLGSTNGGIADRTRVIEDGGNPPNDNGTTPLSADAGQFAYQTQLKTGWANGGPADPRMRVDQRLVVNDGNNGLNTASVDYDFHMLAGRTQLDRVIYFQDAVGTDSAGNGFANPVQFATAKVTGDFQNTAHALSDPDLLPSISGDIAWAANDAIQATWVGGAYLTSDPFLVPSRIGVTSYTNESTGARTVVADISTNPPVAEGWGTITATPTDPFSPYNIPTPVYDAAYDPNNYPWP